MSITGPFRSSKDVGATPEWYNIGKAILGGVSGTIRDPNGLASGAPTYDSDGTITVPLNTGIIAATPATGWSITIPAKTILLRDPRATATFMRGMLRTWLTGWADTAGVLRCGVCLLQGNDPASNDGGMYGVQKAAGTSNTIAIAGVATAGAWTLATYPTSASSDRASTGTYSDYTSTSCSINGSRVSPVTGLATAGGSDFNAQANQANYMISAASSIYLCAWIGTSDGLITAGNYAFRGLAALVDVPTADFVGRA